MRLGSRHNAGHLYSGGSLILLLLRGVLCLLLEGDQWPPTRSSLAILSETETDDKQESPGAMKQREEKRADTMTGKRGSKGAAGGGGGR